MSKILELDASGQLVTVDPRDDVPAEMGMTPVTSSQIPAAAKNWDVPEFRVPSVEATVGIQGPLERQNLMQSLEAWHRATHGVGDVGRGPNQAVATLQRSINALSAFTKNTAIRLVVDGLMGRKTHAATNQAMAIIKAPVSLPLSMTGVKTEAARFAKLIDGWIAGRKAAATKTVAAAKPFRATRKETSRQLQTALRELATLVNNSALSVGVDGIAGPKTQAATNLAFSKYVKTTQVKTLPISPAQVEGLAAAFASEIRTFVTNAKIKAQEQAIAKQKSVDAAKVAAPEKAAAYDRAQVKALQTVLAALAVQVKNAALNVAKDGIMGPKTQAATNLALSRYVSGLSSHLKSGNLTQTEIAKGAMGIGSMIGAEVNRRIAAAKQPAIPPTTESQVSAAAAQKKVDSAKQAAPAAAPAIDRSVAMSLQKALNALYVAVQEPTWDEMKVKVDGIVGPKTRSAVNFALKRVIRAATPAMKTGYTIHQVQKAAPALTKLMWDEIAVRHGENNKREADRIAAQKRLEAKEIEKVKVLAIAAAKGDTDAQKEMQKLAVAATTSKDAKTQQKARDMMDVAVAAAKTVKVEAPKRQILSYRDERKINMPLDMLEDEAELGAMIGLGEHLQPTAIEIEADVGGALGMGEHLEGDVGWGWARRLARRAKRSIKRASRGIKRRYKRIGRRALKLAKRGLRQVKNIALLPLRLQWKLIRRFMLPLAKSYCRLPKNIQLLGAKLADVPYSKMAMFCWAVKESGKRGFIKKRGLKMVKKLMPVALKVAVKLAVQGQFPAAVPIIRSLKMVPGISKLPGMSFIAGDLGMSHMGASLLVTGATAVPGASLLVSDPMAMYDELDSEDLTTMDGDLSDPEGWEYLRDDSPHAGAMGAYWDENGTMGEPWDEAEIGACGDVDCY